jgi:hypothetical protein
MTVQHIHFIPVEGSKVSEYLSSSLWFLRLAETSESHPSVNERFRVGKMLFTVSSTWGSMKQEFEIGGNKLNIW